MQQSVKRWIIGICVGLCIPALIYLRFHRSYSAADVRTAQALGEDVETYHNVRDLYKKVFKTHTLTPEEFADAKSRMSHKSTDTRLSTVMTLGMCDDPALKPQVIALIKTGLSDQSPYVRFKALSGLKHQKDPDLQNSAQQLAQDPSDFVRAEAQSLLPPQHGSN